MARQAGALKLFFWAFVLSLLTLNGCAVDPVTVEKLSRDTYQRVSENQVEVLQNRPQRQFYPIARLSDQGRPMNELLARLRRKAGELGAQAIVITDQSYGTQQNSIYAVGMVLNMPN